MSTHILPVVESQPKQLKLTPLHCPHCDSELFNASLVGAAYAELTCAICEEKLLFEINLGGAA
jgi:transcription elongation factor Elf1